MANILERFVGICFLLATSSFTETAATGEHISVTSCYHDCYPNRLERLDLERLEALRIRADLVLIYTIICGLSELTLSDFFTLSNVTQTRGHMYKLCMPKFRTDVRKYYFCCRVVAIWNDLPADKINFTSLASFTRTLSLLSFDRYCLDSY